MRHEGVVEPAQAGTAIGGTQRADGPLSAQDLAMIEAARVRATKVRRCVTVALFGGWSTAVLALPTLLLGVFSPAGLVLGAAMAVVALNEFRGAARVRRFEESGCRLLALNQVLFCLTMCGYCAWRLWAVGHSVNPLAAESTGDANSDRLLQSVAALNQTLSYALYGAGIALSIVIQGSTALYYWSRRAHVRAYVNSTPAWVVRLQRVARAA